MTFRGMSTLGAAAACAVALAVGCAENPVRPILNSGSSGVNVDWLSNFRDPSTGPWEFAGTVFEHTASGTSRPVAGLELQVTEWPRGERPRVTAVTSDADGRYALVATDTIKVEPAPETGYIAPCPAGTSSPSWSGGRNDFYQPDVHVVHESVLSTSGTPDVLRTLGPYFTGRIVGPAPSHNPVAGADVELDYYGTVLSRTVSDAAGRYVLCSFPPGTGTDQLAIVRARKPGYRDGALETFPWLTADIELLPD